MFPRVVSHYVCLCAEKQNCCAVLAAGHRGAVICADASCSAIKTTAVNFFKIPPHKTKGALARQESRTLRRGVRPSGRLALPNALQSSLHAFARLSCCSYRAATSSLHTQSFSRGKSVPPQATRCWLCQTLVSCAVTPLLFHALPFA